MSRQKARNKAHSYKRAYERLGLTESNAKRMMHNALKHGKAVNKLPDGPIKEYLIPKQAFKRVKVYNNKVFVFSKNSTSCITVYELDKELLEAQRKYDEEKEEENGDLESFT